MLPKRLFPKRLFAKRLSDHMGACDGEVCSIAPTWVTTICNSPELVFARSIAELPPTDSTAQPQVSKGPSPLAGL